MEDGYNEPWWWEPEDEATNTKAEPEEEAAASSTAAPLMRQAALYNLGNCLDDDSDDENSYCVSIRLDYDLDQGIKQTIGNMKYVINEDRRMIDSGAQCCVCPKDYAP